MTFRPVRAAAAAAATAMAFGGLAIALGGEAVSASSRASLHVSDGKVFANGAAIRVPITYLCPAGYRGSVSLQVVQAQGDKFAAASGYDQLSCTGKTKSLNLYMQAPPSSDPYGGGGGGDTRPFRAGSASVEGYLTADDPTKSCKDYLCSDPSAAPAAKTAPAPGAVRPRPVPPKPPGAPLVSSDVMSDDGATADQPYVFENTHRNIKLK